MMLEEVRNCFLFGFEGCDTLRRHFLKYLEEVMRQGFGDWEEASMPIRAEGTVEDCSTTVSISCPEEEMRKRKVLLLR